MDIIKQYETLTRLRRWQEALPLIEEIVQRAPQIGTSWFNLGVCLDELGQHGEAADRFLRAYDLEPSDFGAQYRAFRSLFLAREYGRFLLFAERECKAHPGLIDTLVKDRQFAVLFKQPEFMSLRRTYER